MSLYSSLFFVALALTIGTLLYNLYNIYNGLVGKDLNLFGGIASFIIHCIAWLLSVSVFVNQPLESIYHIFTIFISYLLPLNLLFLLILIFLVVGRIRPFSKDRAKSED